MTRKTKIILLILAPFLATLAIVPAMIIFASIKSEWDEIIAKSNNSGSGSSSISADGRFIAFNSNNTHLPGGDYDKESIYIYDNETGNINLASTNSRGEVANGASGSGPLGPHISADGSTIVFFSQSSNLIEGAAKGLFAKKIDTGEIKPVLITDDDSRRIDNFVMDFSVSSSGRFVVFDSRNGVFVYDTDSNVTTRADVYFYGNELPDAHPGYGVGAPSISADGRYVAFMLTTKMEQKTNGHDVQVDIYIKDMQTGQLTMASKDSQGQPFDYSIRPCLSADGKWLVFENEKNVQLHEVESGNTVKIGKGTHPTISPDGRYIAYEYNEDENSSKANCKANKNCSNLFVFDRHKSSSVREIIPSDWNNWSRMESLAMSDNGIVAFAASGSFEGLEPEECKVHVQQDESSQLIDIYCLGVYRKDLSSGQLERIGDGSSR